MSSVNLNFNNMKTFLLMIFITIGLNSFSQEINYEITAIQYFIENIESKSIFKNSCDCNTLKYEPENKLVIFDSSYIEINPKMALLHFQFDWNDSLLWYSINDKKINIKNDNSLERIKLTKDSKNFNSNHYLIRFSNRLYYNDWVILEFNIKKSEDCSGLNYLFLINKNGQIEKYKLIVLCDNQG